MLLPIIIRKIVPVFLIACFAAATQAQSVKTAVSVKEIEKNAKPYRILTSGKQITIKCIKDIKSLMVWTSDGNRVLEEKNVGASQYQFRITIREKIFFVMLRLEDGKVYSEKFGIE